MLTNDFKIRLSRRWYNDGIDVYIFEKSEGKTAFAMPLTMHIDENEGREHTPSFTISLDIAQRLMDDLWQEGLRPSEGTGSAGSLKATQNHLDDMRKISFDLLEKVKGSL